MPADDPDLRFEVLAEQELVLDRAGRREEQRRVLDALREAAAGDPARRARALVAQGRWLFFHSDYADAVPVAEEAAGLAREAGRGDLEVQALLVTRRSQAFRGHHAAAREHLTSLLPLAHDAGSLRDVAEVLRLLGVVAANLHEPGTATDLLTRSVRTYREAGDAEGEAMASGQLATLHQHTGRLDDALRTGLETLDLTEELGDAEGIVSSLLRLGETPRQTGDLATARAWSERSVAQGREYELHYFVAFASFSLVLVALAEGDLDAGPPHGRGGRRRGGP